MVHRPFKGLVKLDRKYHAMLTMTNLITWHWILSIEIGWCMLMIIWCVRVLTSSVTNMLTNCMVTGM